MTSDRRNVANRKNAQRSTGPTTPEGRAISSRNAVRHGVLCEHVTVEAENFERFDALLEGLWREINPVGEREALLVERLANLFWRERRLVEAERGALSARHEIAADPFGGGTRHLSLVDQLLIGRYQAMLTNQISSTLTQLDKLQSARTSIDVFI